MVEVDEEFEKVESGAALSFPISISDVKKGTHILMGDGRPCKVAEISTSKTGKHGHAKANIVGIDIFNGKKYEDVSPVSHSKDCPNIVRTEWVVNGISDDGYVSLLDLKTGTTREDLRLSEDDDDKEITKRIKDGIEDGKTIVAVVLSSMNIDKIESAKESNE